MQCDTVSCTAEQLRPPQHRAGDAADVRPRSDHNTQESVSWCAHKMVLLLQTLPHKRSDHRLGASDTKTVTPANLIESICIFITVARLFFYRRSWFPGWVDTLYLFFSPAMVQSGLLFHLSPLFIPLRCFPPRAFHKNLSPPEMSKLLSHGYAEDQAKVKSNLQGRWHCVWKIPRFVASWLCHQEWEEKKMIMKLVFGFNGIQRRDENGKGRRQRTFGEIKMAWLSIFVSLQIRRRLAAGRGPS